MEGNSKAAKGNGLTGYYLLLTISAIFAVTSVLIGEYEVLLISLPTAAFCTAIIRRGGGLYIPPVLVILLAIMLSLFMVAKYSFNVHENEFVGSAANVMMGAFLCLIGLFIVYSMMHSMPSFDRDNAFFVSLTSFCIGMSLSVIVLLVDFTITQFSSDGSFYTTPFIAGKEVVMVALGSGFVSILFYLNRHNGLFKHTLDKFLSENAGALGIEDRERQMILDLAETGETSTIEFKSTIRTNLKTGEKDPRMEKAVLKTIVAFLNSRGGTLLIGVADDGTIIGADESSFENQDKMLLHLNNLIKTQIGGEFLPYITYGAFDFDGKTVIKVECIRSESPVFLTEGKTETFFVRSGPSSIDLHGTDMLAYANHNFDSQLRKVYRRIK